MSKAKIGRNDPCPCGSGKKYKNCCITVENETEVDLFTRYNQAITSVKLKLDEEFNKGIRKIRKDAQQSFLRYSVQNRLPENHESLFSDWLWFDMNDDEGDTLAQDYLRNHAEFMAQPLIEALNALAGSYLSVYEPVQTRNGVLEVRDIIIDIKEEIILKEPLGIDFDEKPLLMLGRLAALPEGKIFSGMVLILEYNAEQLDNIISHINYLKALNPEADIISLLKANAAIVYGVFDHAYQKKRIAINDIRALKLAAPDRIKIQEILDTSDQLYFVHDIENVRWYEEMESDTYKRIGLGEDYAVSFVSILEDLEDWDDITGDAFPRLSEWPIVNSRFLNRTPPDEFLAIWYNAIRDQETERWLHTPHNELDGQSPAELIKDKYGRQKVNDLLDRYGERLEEKHQGGSLIKYIRQRIN